MNKEKLKYERQRKKVLKQALIDINTYGFNKNMLVKAAENCNLPEGNLGRLFPVSYTHLTLPTKRIV